MSDSNPKDLAVSLNKKLKNTPNYVNYLKLYEACSILASLDLDITPGRYNRLIYSLQYEMELKMFCWQYFQISVLQRTMQT